MDNKALYSKAMQYQRVAVKNTFSLLSILQDHGERLFKKSLEQNPWLPERSKKACHCLADTCFDSSRLFEKIINRNFDDLEKFYRSGEKQQKKQTQSKRTDVSKSSQSKEKSPGNRSKSGTGASPSAKGATQKKKTKAVKPSKDELPQPKLIQPPTAEQPSVVMSTAVVDPTPADKDTKKEKPQGGNMPQPPSLSDKTQ